MLRSEPNPVHDVTPAMTSEHPLDPEEEEIEFVEPMVFDLVSLTDLHEITILFNLDLSFKCATSYMDGC